MRDQIQKASMKNYAFVSTNKAMHATLELFTEFKFHEVQLMSLYYYCVIKLRIIKQDI